MAIEGPKITIEGYPNEEVILDGTVAINAQWTSNTLIMVSLSTKQFWIWTIYLNKSIKL